MTKDLPGRLLRLLSLLQNRREWSGAELSERLGVSGRTVRRDVDRLRDLGYPVESTTGTAGGYRLASGRALPPLLLEDDEAVAVAVAVVLLTASGTSVADLAEPSARALAKLRHVLPVRLRARFDAIAETVTPVERAGLPRVDPEALGVLASAIRDREMVAFGHRSRAGTATSRRVEPYNLVSIHGLWYLLAYDPDRADWRVFRVDRISEPRPVRWRFTRRPAPDPVAHVARTVALTPYRYRAVATVSAPAETVLARLPLPVRDRVEPIDTRTCRVRFGADSLNRIAAELVSLDADFTLEGPPELREHLDRVRERLRAPAG
ncbi:helix-turn-helix transcriptional regulator [Bailinhaonella thermotolerans]|uniref:YafY family transcriptional regulator n=1 Tax=Bailinhaonella thermotolerans TaxID=1070861 RepID=A0A3A4AQL4_9ACTN|nr:YafY family protein [Bailinhaonella thermotolerans]RJL31371.1 YafY family transcriptional regulator [Bailinhaonella thermotolerans]